MTDTSTTKSHEALSALLESLGIGIDDLVAVSRGRAVRKVPTFGEYIPIVIAAMPKGITVDQYNCVWRKLLAEPGWSDRRLDDPTVTELQAPIESQRAARIIRRNDRGGNDAVRNAVSALRCLYRHAQDDRLIDATENPAARLHKPLPLPSSRLAIADNTLTEINRVAATTGNDPDLDILLLRLHTETACRCIGALRLRPKDLDRSRSVILLREKRWAERWQPVSPTLMTALWDHHRERGGAMSEPLLRYRDGNPLGRNRYVYLWQRLREHISEAQVLGISTHWLRHTTLTWVERHFGKAVAKTYAGHKNRSGSVTDIYTEATIYEVAAAVAALTGEPHPLADQPDLPGPDPTALESAGGQR